MAFFKHLTNITPQGIFLPGQGTCSQMSPQIIGSWKQNINYLFKHVRQSKLVHLKLAYKSTKGQPHSRKFVPLK